MRRFGKRLRDFVYGDAPADDVDARPTSTRAGRRAPAFPPRAAPAFSAQTRRRARLDWGPYRGGGPVTRQELEAIEARLVELSRTGPSDEFAEAFDEWQGAAARWRAGRDI